LFTPSGLPWRVTDVCDSLVIKEHELTGWANVDPFAGTEGQRLWMLHDEMLTIHQFHHEWLERLTLREGTQYIGERFRDHDNPSINRTVPNLTNQLY
jgi:hypothetical protein